MGQKFYIVKVEFITIDDETGKKKKIREYKLVNAYSVTDAEAKVTKVFEHFANEWRITSVVESNIDEVID